MTDSLWGDAAQLGACGRYADAWRIVDLLASEPDAWPSLGHSMRASHLRQVGEVRAAEGHDRVALQEATDPQSRAEALIGLAADAIAAGRPADAHDLLASAEFDASRQWRTSTRWHWVIAELALAEGRPHDALDHARRSMAICESHSARHLAKSRVIAEAARGATGQLDVGGDLLLAAEVSRAQGLATLQWPIALVADDLIGAGLATPELIADGPRLRREGVAAVATIAEGLPENLREAWLQGAAATRLTGGGE